MLRSCGLAVRLSTCFLSLTCASTGVGIAEHWKPENNFLWIANGLLLAYLLLAPRWHWPAYLVTGFLALSVRILFLPHSWDMLLLFNLLDIVEVSTAALLLRRRSAELPRFTEWRYFVRFFTFAVVAAPEI